MAKEVQDQIDACHLTTQLIIARNKCGLTQRQLAKRMGVSASKICRMESGIDADLDFGFVAAYCAALGRTVKVEISDTEQSEAETIRHAVESVRTGLDTLASIATVNKKPDMERKIQAVKADILLDFAMASSAV